jgi:hypothetical protein
VNIDVWAYSVAIWTFGYKTFGEGFWHVVILAFGLVFYDTFLKVVYISKKYIHENLTPDTPIEYIPLRKALYYCFKAKTWNKTYLNSVALSRIIEKLLVYNASLVIAFYAGQVVPNIKLFSTNLILNDFLPGVITVCILVVELSSINENLIELGYSNIANAVKRVIDYVVNKFLPTTK